MIEKYQPSNGTEGSAFFMSWCAKCQREALGIGCEVFAKTMALPVDHPEYPDEWRYDENGAPCCTAFVALGDPVPERCKHTTDMFDDSTAPIPT